jgi:hypothetical protein
VTFGEAVLAGFAGPARSPFFRLPQERAAQVAEAAQGAPSQDRQTLEAEMGRISRLPLSESRGAFTAVLTDLTSNGPWARKF